jgi:hypothetical protein
LVDETVNPAGAAGAEVGAVDEGVTGALSGELALVPAEFTDWTT